MHRSYVQLCTQILDMFLEHRVSLGRTEVCRHPAWWLDPEMHYLCLTMSFVICSLQRLAAPRIEHWPCRCRHHNGGIYLQPQPHSNQVTLCVLSTELGRQVIRLPVFFLPSVQMQDTRRVSIGIVSNIVKDFLPQYKRDDVVYPLFVALVDVSNPC